MHRDRFDELRTQHPAIERILSSALADEVRRLSGLLAEAHFISAEVRTYRRLLELERIFGGDPPTVVPLTQDDLASLAGTTRTTVNRLLGAAQDAGAVKLGRRTVEVLDLDWLERKARA